MTYPLTTGDLVSAADWNALHHAIETLTLSGNSVTFSSIPQGFRHLVIEAEGLLDTSGSAIALRFNGDAGATAYEIMYWEFRGDGTTATTTSFGTDRAGAGVWGNVETCTARITIPGYTDSRQKTFRSETTLHHPSNTSNQRFCVGTARWDTADALTSVTFRASSGAVTFAGGQATLYGIP